MADLEKHAQLTRRIAAGAEAREIHKGIHETLEGHRSRILAQAATEFRSGEMTGDKALLTIARIVALEDLERDLVTTARVGERSARALNKMLSDESKSANSKKYPFT